jgi:hypothetical protein
MFAGVVGTLAAGTHWARTRCVRGSRWDPTLDPFVPTRHGSVPASRGRSPSNHASVPTGQPTIAANRAGCLGRDTLSVRRRVHSMRSRSSQAPEPPEPPAPREKQQVSRADAKYMSQRADGSAQSKRATMGRLMEDRAQERKRRQEPQPELPRLAHGLANGLAHSVARGLARGVARGRPCLSAPGRSPAAARPGPRRARSPGRRPPAPRPPGPCAAQCREAAR